MTIDGAATPPSVKIEAGGTSLTVDGTSVQAGAPGGSFVALASPAFVTWLGAVGSATSVGAPPLFAALKLKAT